MHTQLAVTAAISIAIGSPLQVTAHSTNVLRGLDNIYKHHGYVDHHLRRNIDAIINHGLYHGRNIIPFPSSLESPSTSPTPSTTPSPDPQGWDNQTQAACTTALTSYVNTTNPSGMAVCYNLPYFNNATGAFEADLRLYRVSTPSGDWTGFTEQGISIGLSYPGAAVATSNAPTTRASTPAPGPPSPTDEAPLLMLQVLDLVGMVHADLMAESMTYQGWQALLLPHITLSGLSRSSTPISTVLASTAAAFVHGVFASQTSPRLIAATATQFVLPGTRFAGFPVSLVVTSVWAVALVIVVGLGTWGRVRCRELYRRRVRRGNMGVVKTS